MRLAANISTLFTEVPFLDRFSAARKAGFAGVECWFLDDFPLADVKAALRDCGLPLVVFNMPRSPQSGHEWGCAALPGAQAAFRNSFERAVEMAAELDAYGIHVMAGIVPNDVRDEAKAVFSENLRHAINRIGDNGPVLLIEPINSRDMSGYYLNTSDEAARVVRSLQLPKLKLMFDAYHIQIADGDLTRRLQDFADLIGHVQIAAIPDRGEPDQGEVCFRHMLNEIRQLNDKLWIGCEYKPRKSTIQGMDWIKSVGIS